MPSSTRPTRNWRQAARIAVETVGGELAAQGGDLSVIFCVFGDEAEAAYGKLLAD